MAIYSDKNLYPGINTHLNSFLQNEMGGWQSFHAEHIIDLARSINEHLPAGYFTRSEKSLQISENLPPTGEKPGTTTPDVAIFRGNVRISNKPTPAPLTAAQPVATIPISDSLTDEDYLTGVVIYQAGEGGGLGRPITRIELLSPANKPSGSHYLTYLTKRQETLHSALRLVEIDYLHQTRPILMDLPSYAHRETDAYPYMILVSDPRPTVEQGFTQVFGFGVDEALPIVMIPLAGADTFTFDFGEAYNRTFVNSPFFQMVVDYEQEPSHFERYIEADRTKILAHMKIIKESQQ
jgi:uncharacterized protein DUF4058